MAGTGARISTQRLSAQAEGDKFSLDLLLRHMESGINIFSDTERELLQHREEAS